MTETLITQVSSPSVQCPSKPLLSSDLEAFATTSSSSELDHVTCDLVNQSVQDSYKSASTPVQLLSAGHMAHTPVMQPDQSPGSRCLLTPSMDLGHGYVSKSSPLLSASGSPTPPTPQSHCSASSPLSQQAISDVTSVTLPPLTYTSGSMATDHAMMPPGISSQSPSPIDQAKPGMPPPPKKPLTPYMRFSKSIWQKVKAVNQNSSVCEIGATIGRMWREMSEVDKQHYNDDFVHDKVRYDGELQTYLKATGLQASDLAKPKTKKSRAVVPVAASAQTRPQLMTSNDGGTVGYVDGLTVSDGGNAAPGFQTMAANGIVGGGLPHFGQVWLGNAGSDAYGAEKLLAQMDAEGQSSLFANQSVADHDAVLSFHEDVSQQVASLYGDQNQLVNSVVSAPSGQQQQQQQSQDAAAMTNWLWQQYALANGDQFGGTAPTDSLHQNGTDTTATTGNMIIYQLNADGTQTAFTQSMPSAPTAPVPPSDMLEPGEVRLPQNGPAAPVVDQQIYQGMSTLGYQLPGNGNGQWTNHDGGNATAAATVVGSTDAEKQLLRGALVDKVREIQRLTRELEQAYALIHQLKQHNEFLQRQWGQATMVPAASTDSAAART